MNRIIQKVLNVFGAKDVCILNTAEANQLKIAQDQRDVFQGNCDLRILELLRGNYNGIN